MTMCDTVFGPLAYGPGDYLVLPIGTTAAAGPGARFAAADHEPRGTVRVEPPKRYRNDYGQLLEHERTRQRDVRAGRGRLPEPMRAASSSMSARRTGSPRITTGITRSTSWAGTITSGRSGSTSATSSRCRAGPPATRPPDVPGPPTSWSARSCRASSTTTPSSPAPYNHSNINSDEVIYYVAGNFMSRRGVEIASFTPSGGHPAWTAPGHGRGVHRQGVDRGAGRHGRCVPSAASRRPRWTWTTALPIFLAAARGMPPARRTSSANAVPRRSPTDRPAPASRPSTVARGTGARPGPQDLGAGASRRSVAEAAPMPRSRTTHLVALTALVVSTAMWTAGAASAANSDTDADGLPTP